MGSTYINHSERNLQSAFITDKLKDKILKYVSIKDERGEYGEELRFVFDDGTIFIIENHNNQEPIQFKII